MAVGFQAQPMLNGWAFSTCAISSMRPWQVTQPTPCLTWMEWLK